MRLNRIPLGKPLYAAMAVIAFFSPFPVLANDSGEAETNTITCYFPPDYGATTQSGFPWSGWKIRYAFEPNFKNHDKGGPQYLYIDHAEFLTRNARGQVVSVPVADDLRIAEVYVRYNGKDARTADDEERELTISKLGLRDLGSIRPTPRTCEAASGEDLKVMTYFPLKQDGVVYGKAEYLYDDVRWMQGLKPTGEVQYGHKLVLWSALYSDNYRYLIRYVFFDDGSIELQVGATGHNKMDRAGTPAELSNHTHIHLATWRISFLLGEAPEENEPGIFDYDQNGTTGALSRKRIEVESALDLDAGRYQRLSVFGTTRNNPDSLFPISYDVFPTGSGRMRFGKPIEHFAAHDVWITAQDGTPSEVSIHGDVKTLPRLIDRPPEPLKDRRFDVWCNASFIHIPRQEDFSPAGRRTDGIALTTWSKVRLHPREVSYSSPFYR